MRENITFLPGTPTAFMALTNSPALSRFNTASLKVMISAGSSFPVQAIRALRAAISSPFIEKIEVNKRGKVRRARIYYLRERTGKSARIKERRLVK